MKIYTIIDIKKIFLLIVTIYSILSIMFSLSLKNKENEEENEITSLSLQENERLRSFKKEGISIQLKTESESAKEQSSYKTLTDSELEKKKKHKLSKTNKIKKNSNILSSLSQKALTETELKEKTSIKTVSDNNVRIDSLQNSTFRGMNNTYVKKDIIQFKNENRKFDFKLIDKQLEDIFNIMHPSSINHNTVFSDRAFMEIFLNTFYSCDSNRDNVLNLEEFLKCMKNDTYLSSIKSPSNIYAAFANYTKEDFFYTSIFKILDSHNTNYINFHTYMELRLIIFSWKKCSVKAPFIEETNWECAIDIVGAYKSSSRTTLRSSYYMCLELSNSNKIRNIDFISFIIFSMSARLFGRINGKMDHDITQNEFNLILDENMLPSRYNQFIIENFFKLIHENDRPYEGIDFQSYIYYDYALRLFYNENSAIRWNLNESEFTQSLSNSKFPNHIYEELKLIPSTNFSSDTYQMYTYMNISKFHNENDFLLKFLEKESTNSNIKKNLKTASNVNKAKSLSSVNSESLKTIKIKSKKNNLLTPFFNLASNSTFNLNITANKIFNLIDVNSDDLIDWYDYGNFFQISYLFSKFDPYRKGKIVAGDLYEKFSVWSDFPRVSAELRRRANRFNLLNADSYLDLFTTLIVLRIEDIVSIYTRKTDVSTLYEVELKRIFNKCNLRYINDGLLDKCLRGLDKLNIPKYDWECAFIVGLQENINYLESAASYNTAKANNITLVNTVFYNIDPSLIHKK